MKKLFLILFLGFTSYNLYAVAGTHALERAANSFNAKIQALTGSNIKSQSDLSGIRSSRINIISAQ